MPADLSAQIERAAKQIDPSWSQERAARIVRGVHRQQRRHKQLRGAALGAVVLGLIALSPRLLALLSHGGAARMASTPTSPTVPPQAEPSPVELPPLRLQDGSLARPQGKKSQLHIREQSPGRTVIALAGAAQFDVVHDPLRLFRVETASLAVEVLGTQFLVEELGSRVRVTVQQGRVRVLWASNYDELGAGHSALFPHPAVDGGSATPEGLAAPIPPLSEPAPTPSATRAPALLPVADSGPAAPRPPPRRSQPRSEHAPSHGVTVPPPSAPVPPPPSPPSERSSWQTLAHEGQFEQAYRITYGPPAEASSGTHHSAEPSLLREREVSPGDLLLLADVARLSHHPADAVAPLSRLLREHAADPRAPLAAFTLGRVLLDDLGRPREAAQSFVRTQQLDPDGPLSQDALAREVEAWSRAGEGQSARARALQYVQKYPAGRRLRSVRHFGELL